MYPFCRLDFRPGGEASQEMLPQRLSPRIRRRMAEMESTDAKLKWVTDYKKHFCHGQPNPLIKTDIGTGKKQSEVEVARSHQYVNKTGKLTKVVPPYLSHLKRRTKSAPPIRYSVGDCLVWNSTPVSAPSHRNSPVHQIEKQFQSELTPRPPTSKRLPESHSTPRLNGYKSPTKTEQKSMTPAATAISSFTPIKDERFDFDANKSSSSPDYTTPTVVVD